MKEQPFSFLNEPYPSEGSSVSPNQATKGLNGLKTNGSAR